MFADDGRIAGSASACETDAVYPLLSWVRGYPTRLFAGRLAEPESSSVGSRGPGIVGDPLGVPVLYHGWPFHSAWSSRRMTSSTIRWA